MTATAIASTPARLISESPGIFGYYLRESLILMCFTLDDDNPSHYRLGPVISCGNSDTATIQEMIDHMDSLDCDLVFAPMLTDSYQ